MLHKKSVTKSVKFALKTASSLCATGLLIAGVSYTGVSYAGADLPQGGSVSSGDAHIQYKGDVLHIDQTSDKAIIDWHSFSVGKDNTVNFHQPSTDSATLNRVTGDVTTQIAGQIHAKGSVFLINPNGIMITKDGVIDTGNFVASTLDIDNNDFLNGDFTFTKNGKNGVVDNRGSIQVNDGGFVALLGGAVKNDGIVRAHVGKVGFAGGEKIIMAFGDNDFLRVEVPTDMWNTLQDANGNKLSATIDLNGDIQTNGGFIDITVADASDILRQTISINGIVSANTVSAQDGVISIGGGALNMGDKATITANADTGNAGTIDISTDQLTSSGTVSAMAKNGKGGTIAVALQQGAILNASTTYDVSGTSGGGKISFIGGMSGASGTKVLGSANFTANSTQGKGGYIDISNNNGLVGLFSGTLSASGKTQGGRIRLGGAFQGGAYDPKTSGLDDKTQHLFINRWSHNTDVASATKTSLGTGVHIDISSTHGTGGTAIVWAEDTTNNYAKIDAQGKNTGGAVEISGKRTVDSFGLKRINVGGGIILLDPKNVTLGGFGSNIEQAKKIAHGGGGVTLADQDGFGRSVAISNDGSKLVVGAPFRDSNREADSGAVFLFTVGANTKWGDTITLKLTLADDADLSAGDGFGGSVALNGDGTKLAVGAPISNSGDGTKTGQVYVYTLNSTFSQSTNVVKIADDGKVTIAKDDEFGMGVALSDDGTTLAVTSPALQDADNKDSAGGLYLIKLDNLNAVTSAKKLSDGGTTNTLGMPDLAEDDEFGRSIAMNKDGTKLAVGSHISGKDTVHIFTIKNDLTLEKEKTFDMVTDAGGTPLNSAGLGSALAFSGDGTKLAVGAAEAEDVSGDNKAYGAVFLFNVNADNTVSYVSHIGNDTPGVTLAADDRFGQAVALTDGAQKLVVGAAGDATGGAGRGAAYLFDIFSIPSAYKAQLNAGTDLKIVASNDITVNADLTTTGDGKLTLIAGRSIFVNADIKVKKGINLIANYTGNAITDGDNGDKKLVIADRDAGKAEINVQGGKTLTASAGDVILKMQQGNGNTANKKYTGKITLWRAEGERVSVIHQGTGADVNHESEIVILGDDDSGNKGYIKSTKDLKTGDVGIELVAHTYDNQSSGPAVLSLNTTDTNSDGNGRFLIYAKTLDDAKKFWNRGTAYDFVQFNKSHGGTDFASNTTETDTSKAIKGKSGFVYSIDPSSQVTLNVSGLTTVSKTYDGTTTANKAGASLKIKGVDTATDQFTTDQASGELKFSLKSDAVGVTYDEEFEITLATGSMQANYDTAAVSANKILLTGHTATVKNGKGKPVYGLFSATSNAPKINAFTTGVAIKKRTVYIDASELNVTTRQYDGSVDATVTVSTDSKKDGLSAATGNTGVVPADQGASGAKDDTKLKLKIDAGAFVYADKHVFSSGSNGKQLQIGTAGNIVLQGSSKDNYVLKVKDEKGKEQDLAKNIKVENLKGTITKRHLTVSATAANRVYDGTNVIKVSDITYMGWLDSDGSPGDDYPGKIMDGTLYGIVQNGNVGKNKVVHLQGLTLKQKGVASNYILISDTPNKIDITERVLVLDANELDVSTRAYDNTAKATVNIINNKDGFVDLDTSKNTGKISGDTVSLNIDNSGAVGAGAFKFADANVNANKQVSIDQKSKITLTGTDKDNYVLHFTDKTDDTAKALADGGKVKGLTGTISKRIVYIDASELTISARQYDGTTGAVVTVSTDTKKDGLSALDGNTGVVAADQGANGVQDDNKLKLSIGNGAFVYADKNAGANKQLQIGTVGDIVLQGSSKDNYLLKIKDEIGTEKTIAQDIKVQNLKGTISKRKLYLKADDFQIKGANSAVGKQIYDKDVIADVVLKSAGVGFNIDDGTTREAGKAIKGDNIKLNIAAGAFKYANANKGTNKKVLFTGTAGKLTLVKADTSGVDNTGNYELVQYNGNAIANNAEVKVLATGNANLVGEVTARVLVLDASELAVSARQYEGTTKATVNIATNKDGFVALDTGKGTGKINGDTVTLSIDNSGAVGAGAFKFADKDAGTTKPISIDQKSKITLTGTDKDNYVLYFTDKTDDTAKALADGGQVKGLTGAISKRTLTVTGTVASRVYDGSKAVTVSNGSYSGWLAADGTQPSLADAMTGTLTGSVASGSVGTNKAVTLSGLTLKTTGAYKNYVLAYDTTKKTVITKRIVYIDAGELTVSSREYNGTTGAVVTVSTDTKKDGLSAVSGSTGVLAADQGANGVQDDSKLKLAIGNGAFVYADKNAGNSKQLQIGTVGNIKLQGSSKDNYLLQVKDETGTAKTIAQNVKVQNLQGTINKRKLYLKADDFQIKGANSAVGKQIYDKDVTADVVLKSAGVGFNIDDGTTREAGKAIKGDNIKLNIAAGAFKYATANKGTNKKVLFTGTAGKLTLVKSDTSGADNTGNYELVQHDGTAIADNAEVKVLAAGNANLVGEVTARVLVLDASELDISTRVYDGKTKATVKLKTNKDGFVALDTGKGTGKIDGDTVTLSIDNSGAVGAGAFKFSDKNAGNTKQISIDQKSKITLGGTDKDNYVLHFTDKADNTDKLLADGGKVKGLTGAISKRIVYIDASELNVTARQYDGTTSAGVTVSTDTKKDGLSALDGNTGVLAADQGANGVQNDNKLKLAIGNGAFVYADKNAGANKQLQIGTVANIVLQGSSKDNYLLKVKDQSGAVQTLAQNTKVKDLKGTISKRKLYLKADDFQIKGANSVVGKQIYDKTVTADVVLKSAGVGFNIDDGTTREAGKAIKGDNIKLNIAAGAFKYANANKGANKKVLFSGDSSKLTLVKSDTSGADNTGNYELVKHDGTAIANNAEVKVLASGNANLVGEVTARVLVLDSSELSLDARGYDGTAKATVKIATNKDGFVALDTGKGTGKIASDTVTLNIDNSGAVGAGAFKFADANVNANKQVSIDQKSKITLTGTDKDNYVLHFTDKTDDTAKALADGGQVKGLTGAISKRIVYIDASELTISARQYDGTTGAVVTVSTDTKKDGLSALDGNTGVLAADQGANGVQNDNKLKLAIGNGAFVYADKNAGNSKQLQIGTVANIVLQGSSKDNYLLKVKDQSGAVQTLAQNTKVKDLKGTISKRKLYLKADDFQIKDANSVVGKQIYDKTVTADVVLKSAGVGFNIDDGTTREAGKAIKGDNIKLNIAAGAFKYATANKGSNKKVLFTGDSSKLTLVKDDTAGADNTGNYELVKHDGTAIANNAEVKVLASGNANLVGEVTARVLVLDSSELSLDARGYDGTAKATVKIATNKDGFVALDTGKGMGKINGDTVTLNIDNSGAVGAGAFKFANTNAGANKQVSIDQKSKITLTGTDKDNYVLHFTDKTDDTAKALADGGQVKGLTGTISKRIVYIDASELTVTSRAYDGTTGAVVTVSTDTKKDGLSALNGNTGVLAADQKAGGVQDNSKLKLAIGNGAFVYADKNAGNSKQLQIGTAGNIVLQGSSKDNYLLKVKNNTGTVQTIASGGKVQNLKGTISKRIVYIDASELTISSREYDGTTGAVVTVSTDTKKDGLSAVSGNTGVVTVDQGSSGVQDDNKLKLSIGNGAFVYADKNAGANKQLQIGTVGNIVLQGSSKDNYVLKVKDETGTEKTIAQNVKVQNLKGTISKRVVYIDASELTISARQYDGTTGAVVTVSTDTKKDGLSALDGSTGVVAADQGANGVQNDNKLKLSIGNGAFVYADKNAGNNKQLQIGTVGNIKLQGSSKDNYLLQVKDETGAVQTIASGGKVQNLKGTIDKRIVYIDAGELTVSSREYDGTTGAVVTVSTDTKKDGLSAVSGNTGVVTVDQGASGVQNDNKLKLAIGNGAFVYADKNAGANKQLQIGTVGNIVLQGSSKDNYLLKVKDETGTEKTIAQNVKVQNLKGTISKRVVYIDASELTISARQYDGTTGAVVTVSTDTKKDGLSALSGNTGVLAVDQGASGVQDDNKLKLSIGNGAFVYANKNAGANKQLQIGTAGNIVLQGTSKDNYLLKIKDETGAVQTIASGGKVQNLKGTISKRIVYIDASELTVSSREYDGTTGAVVTVSTDTKKDGLSALDGSTGVVTVDQGANGVQDDSKLKLAMGNGAFVYADKNAGANKQLQIGTGANIVLQGSSKDNYLLKVKDKTGTAKTIAQDIKVQNLKGTISKRKLYLKADDFQIKGANSVVGKQIYDKTVTADVVLKSAGVGFNVDGGTTREAGKALKGDNIKLNIADGAFKYANANKGSNKKVLFTGDSSKLTLVKSDTSGADNTGNYELVKHDGTAIANNGEVKVLAAGNATLVGEVTARVLVLDASELDVSTHAYDGTTKATVKLKTNKDGFVALDTGKGTGKIASDAVTLSIDNSGAVGAGAFKFADKNAGNSKQVSIDQKSKITLTGASKDNYVLHFTDKADNTDKLLADGGQVKGLTGTISKHTLIVTGTVGASRVYNGSKVVTVSNGRYSGWLAVDGTQPSLADAMTGTLTGSVTDGSVGTHKAVTLSGLTLSNTGVYKNYVLAYDTTQKIAITKRVLVLDASELDVSTRVYDGTTKATVNIATNKDGFVALDTSKNTGKIASDAVTLSIDNSGAVGAGAFKFADKNAGTTKPISIDQKSKITLTGTDKDNYVLYFTDGADDTAKILADNGQVKGLTGAISKRTLTVTGTVGASRVYNGSKVVTVGNGSYRGWLAVDGTQPSLADAMTGTLTGSVTDGSVGTHKAVTLSGLTLKTTGAYKNYVLAYDTTQKTAITKRVLVLDASELDVSTRVYDGTTKATVKLKTNKDGFVALDTSKNTGKIASDAVTLTIDNSGAVGAGAFKFADKDAGTTKQISIDQKSKITLMGTDKDNYVLYFTDKTDDTAKVLADNGQVKGLTGAISKRTLTVTGTVGASRVYDGSKVVTVGNGSYRGWLAVDGTQPSLADAMTGTLTGSVTDGSVGTHKAVTLSGLTLKTTGAYKNYVLAYDTTQKTAITKRVLVLDASELDVSTRVYDGTTKATVKLKTNQDGFVALDTGKGTGKIDGDTVTLSIDNSGAVGAGAFKFSDKNAGNTKQISIDQKSKITLGGTDKDNYVLHFTDKADNTDKLLADGGKVKGLTGAISKRIVYIDASELNVTARQYDGTTSAGVIVSTDTKKDGLSALNGNTGVLDIDQGASGVQDDNKLKLAIGNGAFVYADKNAGNSKQLQIGTAGNIVLQGSSKDNYLLKIKDETAAVQTIASGGKVQNLKGTIDKRIVYIDAGELTVSSREYDGTMGAVVTVSTDTKKDGLSAVSGSTGVLAADQGANGVQDDSKLKLAIGNGAFVYANKNAGANKQLQIGTVGNIVLQGSSAGNYDLKVKDETGTAKTIAQNIKVQNLKGTIAKRKLYLKADDFQIKGANSVAGKQIYDKTVTADVVLKSAGVGFNMDDGTTRVTGQALKGDNIKLNIAAGAFKYANANKGSNKKVLFGDSSKLTLVKSDTSRADNTGNYELVKHDGTAIATNGEVKVLATGNANLVGEVTARVLVLDSSELSLDARGYDGTSKATVNIATNKDGFVAFDTSKNTGKIASDTVTLNIDNSGAVGAGAFKFADANVNANKQVSIDQKSKITLTGASKDNYVLHFTDKADDTAKILADGGKVKGLTGAISKRIVYIDASELTISARQYDGTTGAGVTVSTDTKKDGLSALSGNTGVLAADQGANGVQDDNKLKLAIGNGAFVYANKNAGNSKQLQIGTVGNIVLQGSSKDNYLLKVKDETGTAKTIAQNIKVQNLKGTINKRIVYVDASELTVSSREYDGTMGAIVTVSTDTKKDGLSALIGNTGVLAADQGASGAKDDSKLKLAIGNGAFVYTDKNAGNSKQLQIGTAGNIVLQGSSKDNYLLKVKDNTGAVQTIAQNVKVQNLKGTINKRAVYIDASELIVTSRQYDGTTDAVVTVSTDTKKDGLSALNGNMGVVAVDQGVNGVQDDSKLKLVIGNGTFVYADKNAGNSKQLQIGTAGNIVLQGSSKDNYLLKVKDNTGAVQTIASGGKVQNLKGTINKRTLTVTTTVGTTREYDGSKGITVGSATYGGWMAADGKLADGMSGALTGTVASVDVGANKAVTLSGLTLKTTGAYKNYALVYDTSKKTTVTQRILTVNINDLTVETRDMDGTKNVPVSVKDGMSGLSGTMASQPLKLQLKTGAFVYKTVDAGADKKVYMGQNDKFVLTSTQSGVKIGNYKLQLASTGTVVNGLQGTVQGSAVDSSGGGSGGGGSGGGGGGGAGIAVVAVGVVVATNFMTGTVAGAAGTGAVGADGVGGVSDEDTDSKSTDPTGALPSVFNGGGLYAHLHGIHVRGITHPQQKSIFTTAQMGVAYNVKYATTYDMALLANNIRVQQVLPLYEMTDDMYESIKQIFVKQGISKDKTPA